MKMMSVKGNDVSFSRHYSCHLQPGSLGTDISQCEAVNKQNSVMPRPSLAKFNSL